VEGGGGDMTLRKMKQFSLITTFSCKLIAHLQYSRRVYSPETKKILVIYSLGSPGLNFAIRKASLLKG